MQERKKAMQEKQINNKMQECDGSCVAVSNKTKKWRKAWVLSLCSRAARI